jgi:hypothetical protein
VQKVLSSSFYVLLARDWNQKVEKKLRNTFAITKEYSFPNVKLLQFTYKKQVEGHSFILSCYAGLPVYPYAG